MGSVRKTYSNQMQIYLFMLIISHPYKLWQFLYYFKEITAVKNVNVLNLKMDPKPRHNKS